LNNLTPEHLISSQNKLGEGSLWLPDEDALYWMDIYQAMVEKFVPSSGERQIFQFNAGITVLGIRAKGGFITGTTQGFAFWDEKTENLEMISNPFDGIPHIRFNDGAVDRQGRFWAGSMMFRDFGNQSFLVNGRHNGRS
jgi:sugar lactone lactonase YvrE